MQSDFLPVVQHALGPFLERNQFEVDAVDESTENELAVVYFRSHECKLQVYSSPRNGEINCMIATTDAPNEWGAKDSQRDTWRFIHELSGRNAGASVEELLERQRVTHDAGPRTDAEQLESIRNLLESDFTAACARL